MAKSPAHRFGQIIGDLLEKALIDYCRPIAQEYGMYLDYKHKRAARQNKREVQWIDINGNKHKLDIVIEENGNEEVLGHPRAFIEMAWRRYTKHSKNKAQEISGAIKPLISKYHIYCPFFGAVLAGEFTENSLNQLKSEGFQVLYFSMSEIENAFLSQGIDAHWEEDTPEEVLQERVEQYEALNEEQTDHIIQTLLLNNAHQLDLFCTELRKALQSQITGIDLVSLYSCRETFSDIGQVCRHMETHHPAETPSDGTFYQTVVVIRYSNGQQIQLPFSSHEEAAAALRTWYPTAQTIWEEGQLNLWDRLT